VTPDSHPESFDVDFVEVFWRVVYDPFPQFPFTGDLGASKDAFKSRLELCAVDTVALDGEAAVSLTRTASHAGSAAAMGLLWAEIQQCIRHGENDSTCSGVGLGSGSVCLEYLLCN
jgi:hypothetical protein